MSAGEDMSVKTPAELGFAEESAMPLEGAPRSDDVGALIWRVVAVVTTLYTVPPVLAALAGHATRSDQAIAVGCLAAGVVAYRAGRSSQGTGRRFLLASSLVVCSAAVISLLRWHGLTALVELLAGIGGMTVAVVVFVATLSHSARRRSATLTWVSAAIAVVALALLVHSRTPTDDDDPAGAYGTVARSSEIGSSVEPDTPGASPMPATKAAMCEHNIGEGVDDAFTLRALVRAYAFDPAGLKCATAAARPFFGAAVLQPTQGGILVAHPSGHSTALPLGAMAMLNEVEPTSDWRNLGGFFSVRLWCGLATLYPVVAPGGRVSALIWRASSRPGARFYLLRQGILERWFATSRGLGVMLAPAAQEETVEGQRRQRFSGGGQNLDLLAAPTAGVHPADLKTICAGRQP